MWRVLFGTVVLVLAVPARGEPVTSTVAARTSCESLRSTDFSRIPDAPTQVIEANRVSVDGDVPEYCQASGYVAANVGFVLRLPTDHWNGKFIELGCGGFCGSTEHIAACDRLLRRGYACLVSDSGHRSTAMDGKWAYHNLQAQVDFAYRATHVAALAGKAVAQYYYRSAPRHSYFEGCSTGGRQALMEAQRFPWDFDGIIAGAPVLNAPKIHMNLLWSNRALLDATGRVVLERPDLELLHQAVLKQCDLNDGIEDGLIGDPRACRFDPAPLLCSGGKTAACLTKLQVEAAKKIYGGPTTSTGEQIDSPGALPGSERTWLDWDPHVLHGFVGDSFRYFSFDPPPGPSWKPEDFDFDQDYKRITTAQGVFAADNPDLRAFKSAGGKLLVYAGWNDTGVTPLPTVDYYETAERTLHGRATTGSFFRLFMIPGMNHCTGGDGAFAVDWLSYLDDWVEKGRPPDVLVSSHVRLEDLRERAAHDDPNAVRALARRLEFPLDPQTIEFSRPVYPYPVLARYRGHGDPKAASSFEPASAGAIGK